MNKYLIILLYFTIYNIFCGFIAIIIVFYLMIAIIMYVYISYNISYIFLYMHVILYYLNMTRFIILFLVWYTFMIFYSDFIFIYSWWELLLFIRTRTIFDRWSLISIYKIDIICIYYIINHHLYYSIFYIRVFEGWEFSIFMQDQLHIWRLKNKIWNN